MSTEQTDHEIAQSGNDAQLKGESAPAEKVAVRSSSSRASEGRALHSGGAGGPR